MELQRMWVSLMLKADEFRSGLNAAEAEARGWGGRVQSAVGGGLSRLAGIGQAAFLGVGAAAVGGFGLAMGAAIDMNAQLETSTLQFTTLMGSADEAQAHVGALFDFAASTPFESQEIIDASLKLQTFGGEALNTLDNLTLVGDAAAAVGAPIDEVSFWVGRLYSNLQAGQPFGEAAARLQELGIMGPEARAQLEGMQAAGLGANEIFTAFQGQLGSFTGAMELQAGTWQGLMSTIRDNLSMAAAQGLKPFFDLAKQGLEGLASWLSSPEVQAGIQQMAQGFTDLIQRVADFVTTHVVPFVQTHGPQLKAILIALAAAFGALLVIGAVTSAIALLANPITLIVAVVGALAAAWASNWGGIRDKTQAVWTAIQPVLQTVWDWLQVHVPQALEFLRRVWVDVVWPAIKRVVEIVWPVIQTIFRAIGDFITDTLIPTIQSLYKKWTEEVWPVIQTVTQNVWTIIEEIFTEIGRWINDNIVPWIEFLHEKWVNVVWPGIQTALETAWGIIEPIWEAIREWAQDTIPPIVEALKPLFEGAMSGISAAVEPVKQVWDAFVGAVQGFWEWLKNKVFNFQINLPDLPDWAVPGSPLPIHVAWEDFAEAMPGIASAISNGFVDMADSLYDILDPMGPVIDGLGGMLDMAGTVGGIAGGFARRFETKVIDPLRTEAEALEGYIPGLMDALAPVLVMSPQLDFSGWVDPSDRTAINNLRWLLNSIPANNLDLADERTLLKMAVDTLEERYHLNNEIIHQEERMLALQQAQADLDFLKSQMDLLKLVRENAGILPANILDGLVFGLEADSGLLMDTMVDIMEWLVRSASSELQIHSPSRVFEEMGRMVNAGFAEGLEDTRGIERSLERGLAAALDVGRAVEGGRRTTVNGGYHVHWYGDETPALEELEVLAR